LRLADVPVGESATILCISEVVEDEEALILYLHEKGLTPETQLTIIEPDSGISASGSVEEHVENFKVLVAGREVCISKSAAAKIWVTR
ncbi:MAG TPA: FeoA family protein, partial [Ktedonobacteraceae bacterium]|nr:FeoA family protein [Ktedonobacteraceae bacterium]